MAEQYRGAKPKLPRGSQSSNHDNKASQTGDVLHTNRKDLPGLADHSTRNTNPSKGFSSLVYKPQIEDHSARNTSPSKGFSSIDDKQERNPSPSKKLNPTRSKKATSYGQVQLQKGNCQKRKFKTADPDGLAHQSFDKNLDDTSKTGNSKVIKADSMQLVKPAAVLIRDSDITTKPCKNNWTKLEVEDEFNNCVRSELEDGCHSTDNVTFSEDTGFINENADSTETDSSPSCLSEESLEGDWRPLSSSTNHEEVNKLCDCDVATCNLNCDGDWTFNVHDAKTSPATGKAGDQWIKGHQSDRETVSGQHVLTGWNTEKAARSQQCKGNQPMKQQRKIKRNRKISSERAGLLDNVFTSSDDDQYEFVYDEDYGEIVRRKKCPFKQTIVPKVTQSKPRDTPVSDSDNMKPSPEAGTSPMSTLKHALPYLPERLRDRLMARHAELSSTSDHSATDLSAPDHSAPDHDVQTAPYHNDLKNLATGQGSQQSEITVKAKPYRNINDNNNTALGKGCNDSIKMVKALIRSRNSSSEQGDTKDCNAAEKSNSYHEDGSNNSDRLEVKWNNHCDKSTDDSQTTGDIAADKHGTNSGVLSNGTRKLGDSILDNSRQYGDRGMNNGKRNTNEMIENGDDERSRRPWNSDRDMCNTERQRMDRCNKVNDKYFHAFERCLEDPFRVRDESGVSFCSGLIDLIDDIDLPLVGETDDDIEDRDEVTPIAGGSVQEPARLDKNKGDGRKTTRVREVRGQASRLDKKAELENNIEEESQDELTTLDPSICKMDEKPISGSCDTASWQSGSGSDEPGVNNDDDGDDNDDDVESCGEADDEFECDCEACSIRPYPPVADPEEDLGDDFERDLDLYLRDRDMGRQQRWEEMRYGAEADLPSPENLLGFTGGLDVGLDLGLESLEPNSLGVLLDSSLRQIVLIESVIQQMLAIQPDLLSSQAAPPAPSTVIDSLTTITLTLQHTEQHPKCPICLSPCEVEDVMCQLPCQHLFHPACVRAWLTKSGTCPVCRQVVTG